MTVQDMDICLNISTHRMKRGSVMEADDPFENTVQKFKEEVVAKKPGALKVKVNGSVRQDTAPKRIKQKSLATIVATKLKAEKASSIIQNKQIETVSVVISTNKNVKGTVSKPSEVDAQKKIRENKEILASQLPSSTNTADGTSISFTKVKKRNLERSVVARKRNALDIKPKQSLSDIFAKKTEYVKTNLLNAEPKNTITGNKSQDKVIELVEPKITLPRNKKAVQKVSKEKKEKDVKSRKQKSEKAEFASHLNGSKGKVSSLFGHNPEIPNIGQRLIKPVNEVVFTGTKFRDLGVHPFMVSNLEQNMKITKMTMVQQKAIPQILSGKDILIRSQTGSGKTLAFSIPIVERLQKIRPKLTRNSGISALIIVPTRELVMQTYECLLKLIKSFVWIVPGYLTGGERRKAEKIRLKKGCNILVSTPGRLLDHIKNTSVLRLNKVKCFVLDEADRMFDMGYEKHISRILTALKVADSDASESEYNPMEMLKQNVNKKTIFTEEDIASVEKNQENNSTVEHKHKSKSRITTSKNNESDDEADQSDSEKHRERKAYHSSSDDDDENMNFPIKSKHQLKEKSPIRPVKKKTESKPNLVESSTTDLSRRQTILLSATLTKDVEKLAGLAMEDPIFVDAAKENLECTGTDVCEINEDLIVPQSVNQSYIVIPPKLRLVSLSAYIAGKCQTPGQHKILVFMATQDMVDYHTELLSAILTKPTDEDDDDSDPLVDVEFYKLHGNMTQNERKEVFKTFRQTRSGVLLCTDVAARGLDLPKVDCVVQYTGPLSASDYVHRMGRTGRAGSSGSATIFLTPPEIEFVRMLESRRIRIRQEDMDNVLDKLLGPLSKHRSAQVAATALQNEFESLVVEDSKLRQKACKAYVSWVRFYASYPHNMREIFNRKELHLGHYAKSFALRDTPQRIGGIGKTLREDEAAKRQHNNRLSYQEEDAAADQQTKKQQQPRDRNVGSKPGALKRVRMLNISEFDSGLEPLKKSKKS